jgi:hypothetical protein
MHWQTTSIVVLVSLGESDFELEESRHFVFGSFQTLSCDNATPRYSVKCLALLHKFRG